MTIVLISLILILIAGIANGLMDAINFHDVLDGKKFWDIDTSWLRKYKDNDPSKGSKFWLSTTALVFLTDGWHLLKTIERWSYFIIMVLNINTITYFNYNIINNLLEFGIIWSIWQIGFTLTYKWEIIKNKNNGQIKKITR